MRWNKKNLLIAVLFFFFAIFCGFSLFTEEVQSYYITGLIVFTLVGIGFLKQARK